VRARQARPNTHGTFALTAAGKETARRSEPFSLIRYRCRWFGRAAPWDACQPFAGSLALLARLLTAALLLAGLLTRRLILALLILVSSWFFLSWNTGPQRPRSSGLFLTKKKECFSPCRNHCQPETFRFAFSHRCPLSISDCAALNRDWLTPRENVLGSAIIIRTHNYRPTNKRGDRSLEATIDDTHHCSLLTKQRTLDVECKPEQREPEISAAAE